MLAETGGIEEREVQLAAVQSAVDLCQFVMHVADVEISPLSVIAPAFQAREHSTL
jgi:hypothetical protein